MLIAEYDYDLDIEVQREEAYTEGLEKGKELGKELGKQETFEELIKRKLEKGKTPEEIADALEWPLEEVQKIILAVKKDVK